MSGYKACLACEAQMVPDISTPCVAVMQCRRCKHRVARHSGPVPSADYHEQYDAGGFLEALRATRIRQARRILGELRACAPNATRLLDFGCGRGWFLDGAREAGWQVAGADTSEVAVRLLEAKGIANIHLETEPYLRTDRLPFRPQVLTLLDVAEHFPPTRVVPVLSELVTFLRPELQMVVVKVPVSNGLLYKMASALLRTGARGPIDQLFQVGTEPPHQSYFSRRSAQTVLEKAGLHVVHTLDDRDFEPAHFLSRMRSFSRVPAFLANQGGRVAAGAISALGLEDSLILFGR